MICYQQYAKQEFNVQELPLTVFENPKGPGNVQTLDYDKYMEKEKQKEIKLIEKYPELLKEESSLDKQVTKQQNARLEQQKARFLNRRVEEVIPMTVFDQFRGPGNVKTLDINKFLTKEEQEEIYPPTVKKCPPPSKKMNYDVHTSNVGARSVVRSMQSHQSTT